MSKGWISIHRKLQRHWLWSDKPFSKGQAWIDLLMSANHEDSRFLLGSQLVDAKKGDVVTSEVKLMDKWGWSKSKVRTFLSLLEKDSMIVKKTDSKKTTLSLTNYGVWQDSQTTERPLEDHLKTTRRPLEDTINNSNNSNNTNNSNKDNISIDHFEEFWKVYPKKLAKTLALKCWKTLIKNGASIDDLITASKNYALAMKGKDQQFMLQVSTFLGPQKRYEDFIKVVPVKADNDKPTTKKPNKYDQFYL